MYILYKHSSGNSQFREPWRQHKKLSAFIIIASRKQLRSTYFPCQYLRGYKILFLALLLSQRAELSYHKRADKWFLIIITSLSFSTFSQTLIYTGRDCTGPGAGVEDIITSFLHLFPFFLQGIKQLKITGLVLPSYSLLFYFFLLQFR